MQMNDMIVMSVDDYVIEPVDAFLKHMPAKFKSKALPVEMGKDYWRL